MNQKILFMPLFLSGEWEENAQLFNIKLINGTDLTELIVRFLITTAVFFIVVQCIYARNSKRKDYYFSFLAVGATTFLLCFLLNSVKLELGFALGLFAIFGIIRYRTDAIPIKEMTYIFVIIGIAVINALANKKISYAELLLTNSIFIVGLWLLEKRLRLKTEQEIELVYEKIENIHSSNKDELLEDLKQRTGLNIHRFIINKIDFLKDTAELTLFYFDNGNSGNSKTVKKVNHMMKSIIQPNIFIACLFFSVLFTNSTSFAQDTENEFQTRTSVELSKKIVKKLKFEFSPEMRWDDNFNLDRYQLSSELKYKALKFMHLSAGYRFIGNVRKEKETEYFHRYQFCTVFKKELNRWEPGLKIKYTNYTDENIDEEFMRYKFSLGYDIRKSKITPEAGFEIFHLIDKNKIYKYRYMIGFDYKLSKRLIAKANYKFDYYKTEYLNKHIIDVGLKIKI